VKRGFSEDATAMLERLEGLRREDVQLFGDRIIRCLIYCTYLYPKHSLENWIKQARFDWRDLIVAAEYDRSWKQLRDFNQPFEEEHFAPTEQR
jgi:hypothetical protein